MALFSRNLLKGAPEGLSQTHPSLWIPAFAFTFTSHSILYALQPHYLYKMQFFALLAVSLPLLAAARPISVANNLDALVDHVANKGHVDILNRGEKHDGYAFH